MKHNKYILALAFASMLTLGSCGDDFLGKEPQGVLTPEALANAQGVELLVTSAYAGLASPVEGYWINASIRSLLGFASTFICG